MQIADLLALLQDYNGTAAPALSLPRTLDVSYQESVNLQLLIEYQGCDSIDIEDLACKLGTTSGASSVLWVYKFRPVSKLQT